MQELTNEQFTNEMKTFEALCNKAQNDLQSYVDGCEDLMLKDKLIKRHEGFEKLINYVVNETNFIKAPASTRYHLWIPHGTLIHSNSVCRTALTLNAALKANIPIYKLITCALLHDLGKEDDYIENEPTEKQKRAGYKATPPYKFNDNEIMQHECESLYKISKFIDLDEDEFIAIQYHNSPWDGIIDKVAFKKCPLMTILQNADYWSSLYLEDRPE